MKLGTHDMHLLGKLLSEFNDEDLLDAGFTPRERVRAEAIFEDLERYLTGTVGPDWQNKEVQ